MNCEHLIGRSGGGRALTGGGERSQRLIASFAAWLRVPPSEREIAVGRSQSGDRSREIAVGKRAATQSAMSTFSDIDMADRRGKESASEALDRGGEPGTNEVSYVASPPRPPSEHPADGDDGEDGPGGGASPRLPPSPARSIPTAVIVNNPASSPRSPLYIEGGKEGGRRHKGPCSALVKVIFIIMMVGILLTGALLLTVGILVLTNASPVDDSASTSIRAMGIGTTAVGGVVILLSIVGFSAAITESRLLSATFILILILALVANFAAGKKLSTYVPKMGDQWGGLSADTRSWLQESLSCCGYESSHDRAVRPCPSGVKEGCASSLESVYDIFLKASYAVLAGSTGSIAILIGLITLITFARYGGKDSSSSSKGKKSRRRKKSPKKAVGSDIRSSPMATDAAVPSDVV